LRVFQYILIALILTSGMLHSQSISRVVPDTGRQSMTFPITVYGLGTEFTLSPYFVINFDSLGVGTNNVLIVNDTTLTGNIFIDGKASYGFHRCIVADEFSNIYTKDSAFFVYLGVPPPPVLLLPFDNATNVLQTPYLLWDSNGYVTSFRIQVSMDSLFGSMTYDTVVANTPLTIRPGVLSLNTKYFWRVNATNSLGTSPWSTVFRFRVRTTGITNLSEGIPEKFILHQNYPNPFNPVTKFRFELARDNYVRMNVYDVSGKLCAEIVNGRLKAGIYEALWNAEKFASGIYFYTIETEGFREVKKAVLLK
jgi:hypothetical protein